MRLVEWIKQRYFNWLMYRVCFVDFGPTGFGSGDVVIKKGMFLTKFQRNFIEKEVIVYMRFLRRCWRQSCLENLGEEPGSFDGSNPEKYETENLSISFVEQEQYVPKTDIARSLYYAGIGQS